MISVRLRLLLILLFFGSIASGLGARAAIDFREMREFQRQLDLSYQVSHEAHASSDSISANSLHRLQKWKAQLAPATRAASLDAWLTASEQTDKRRLRDLQTVLLKNEAEYQRFAREHIDYLEPRVLTFGAFLLLTIVLTFAILFLFVQSAVVRPMREISRKMTDFMHDRYTYQFSVPSHDEFGRMQSTFNQLAQRVITNMDQLRGLDQAKSDFLSIASHELRTPLTSIKGSLSLMRTGVVGPMNEMAENLLQIAETETDRLIRLINDLLDLAKIEAGKLPLHVEWTSLHQIIRSTFAGLSGLAQAAEVNLEMVNVPQIRVNADRDRIQQVLTNLLSNAIKYSPKGSPVLVSVEVDNNNHLQIAVRDFGRGIDPVDQQLIFEKFRQATSPKNPLIKGTGLGLAIAKALVEEHHGQIGVRSTPGTGSVFFFTLPEWKFAQEEKQAAA